MVGVSPETVFDLAWSNVGSTRCRHLWLIDPLDNDDRINTQYLKSFEVHTVTEEMKEYVR